VAPTGDPVRDAWAEVVPAGEAFPGPGVRNRAMRRRLEVSCELR